MYGIDSLGYTELKFLQKISFSAFNNFIDFNSDVKKFNGDFIVVHVSCNGRYIYNYPNSLTDFNFKNLTTHNDIKIIPKQFLTDFKKYPIGFRTSNVDGYTEKLILEGFVILDNKISVTYSNSGVPSDNEVIIWGLKFK